MKESAIEKVAQTLLEKNDVNTWPVDINKIISTCENMQLIPKDLEDSESGFLVVKNDISVVVINQNHHKNRQRFTAAHELGHYSLHCKDDKDKIFVDKRRTYNRNNISSQGTDNLEIEANTFAAMILMPEKFINDYIANHDLEDFNEEGVCRMAEEFQVSNQAMSIRLSKLGYDVVF
jgi:Zn-dependent peptidase ImmA (M78 family)